MYYVGQHASHLRTVGGRGTPKIARPRPGGGPRVAKELRWRNESFKTIVPGGARRLRWCYRKRELCTKTRNTILYYWFYYYHYNELTHRPAVIYFSSTIRKPRYQTPSPPTGMHAETHRGQNTVWAYRQNRTARRLIDDWVRRCARRDRVRRRPFGVASTPPPYIANHPRSNRLVTIECTMHCGRCVSKSLLLVTIFVSWIYRFFLIELYVTRYFGRFFFIFCFSELNFFSSWKKEKYRRNVAVSCMYITAYNRTIWFTY